MSGGDDRPIKVTVTDPDSGDVLGERILANDYMVLTAGDRYLANVQANDNGTHVVTIKRSAR